MAGTRPDKLTGILQDVQVKPTRNGGQILIAKLNDGSAYPIDVVMFNKTLNKTPNAAQLNGQNVTLDVYPNRYNIVSVEGYTQNDYQKNQQSNNNSPFVDPTDSKNQTSGFKDLTNSYSDPNSDALPF